MIERSGLLTLLETTNQRTNDGHIIAVWKCACGNTKKLALSRVRSGQTRSCGCLIGRSSKHGMKGTPEYSSWTAMIRRCHSEKAKDYPRYGAVGITVCLEWRESFSAFFEHVGPRPAGTTLDRKNPRDGYVPGNVRWATPSEQSLNRRDIKVVSTPLGTMPLSEYAKKIGLTRGAAHLRMKRGTLKGCSYV